MAERLRWHAVLLFINLLIAPALEGRTWSGVKSDHFEVYAKRSGAEKVTRQLEQLRAVLDAAGLVNRAKERSVHVLIFDNEKDYFRYGPAGSTGFFQSCGDYDFIGLLAIDPDVVGHEYVHAVMSWKWPHAPTWMQEGLAEFYSTARRSEKGITIGGLKWGYADIVDNLSARRLPALTMARSGLIRADRRESYELYGLAWAAVSLLKTTDTYRGGSDKFLTAISNAAELPEALSRIYGVSVNRFVTDLDCYLKSEHFASIEYVEYRSPVVKDMRTLRMSATQAEKAMSRNLEVLAYLNPQLGFDVSTAIQGTR
jgi:hypothetical protein